MHQTTIKHTIRIIFLLALATLSTTANGAATILVGRVAAVDGALLRLAEAPSDWVEVDIDSPAAEGDRFYAAVDSRAEFVLPNSMTIRADEFSEMEILALDQDHGVISLDAGLIRAVNRHPGGELEIRTPHGIGIIPAGACADIEVMDNQTRLSPITGSARFIRIETGDRTEEYEITGSLSSLIIDRDIVESGLNQPDPSWQLWNNAREELLAETMDRSMHLPVMFQQDSRVFANQGHWESRPYRGHVYWCWRPDRVGIDWMPFTRGHWINYHGDRAWVSHEPWGWTTDHYGDWILLANTWWWTPYIQLDQTPPGARLADITVGLRPAFRRHWHPGRVMWLTSRGHTAWIPLAPRETFYSLRPWGPRTVVTASLRLGNLGIDINGYHHLDRVVMVPDSRLYYPHVRPARNTYNIQIVNIRNPVNRKNFIAGPAAYQKLQPRRHHNTIVRPRQRLRHDGQGHQQRHGTVVERHSPSHRGRGIRDDWPIKRKKDRPSEGRKRIRPKQHRVEQQHETPPPAVYGKAPSLRERRVTRPVKNNGPGRKGWTRLVNKKKNRIDSTAPRAGVNHPPATRPERAVNDRQKRTLHARRDRHQQKRQQPRQALPARSRKMSPPDDEQRYTGLTRENSALSRQPRHDDKDAIKRDRPRTRQFAQTKTRNLVEGRPGRSRP